MPETWSLRILLKESWLTAVLTEAGMYIQWIQCKEALGIKLK